MDNLSLSDQINQSENYSSNERNIHNNRFKIIILGASSVLIIILFTFVGFIYLKYLKLKSQKPMNSGERTQQEIELFERFPNSSNKGNMAIDQDFIWVANGAGLIRYNKNTGEQKIFTESDGLLGGSTDQVLKYKDEIWVTSHASRY